MNKTTLYLSLLSLACTLPALILIWQFLTDNLGANPVEALEHNTGDWTLYFLLLSLSITPIQRFIKPKWPVPSHLIRRTLGLSAFGFALLHATAYLLFDMGLSPADTLLDLMDRPFILIGFIALLLLAPLAITSTANWQKRLKQNWRKLHKTIYFLTFLGILHYLLLVKADLLEPLIYLGVFGILLLARIIPKNH